MTTALVVRDKREPAKASGRLRRAAEHYVRNGCKAIGPSLIWAGFSPATAREPTKNGYTHDWLVAVARYWNKGSQETARSHLSAAIASLAGMLHDTEAPHAARGAAAKTIIDVATKEREQESTAEVAAEEQARWMTQIRHWKRTFLRRGILMGMFMYEREGELEHPGMGPYTMRADRAQRILCSLNWLLGKGPRPAWMDEGEDDGEGVQRSEGDSQSGAYIEAEVVEIQGEDRLGYSPSDETGTGPSSADPE